MSFFQIRKKVHWSDCDAAGVVWFPNFLGWFEDAEEELYASTLGVSRQSILDAHGFGMPRVEASIKYRAPVRAGAIIRIGIRSTIENPRRLRHEFEMRDEASGTLLAEGFVRVASIDLEGFTPRDFPEEVLRMVREQRRAVDAQRTAEPPLPWT